MKQRNANWPGATICRALANATTAALRLGATCFFMLCFSACTPDVRGTALRTQCQQQLAQIHSALIEYVKAHGDIPRDEHGTPSLEILRAAGFGLQNDKTPIGSRCPGAAQGDCGQYVLNPRLLPDDLMQRSTTIVACDRCANHRSGSNGRLITVALLGHGTTVLTYLSEAEQAEWRKAFFAGDEKAAVVKIVQDTDGAESLMWYLGKEKGYVRAH